MAQLSETLSTLVESPSDYSAQRRAVRGIITSVVSMLRDRVDYDTAAEIANDTARTILLRADTGEEVNVGLVYGIARNLYRKHVERCTAQKRQQLDPADVVCSFDDQPIEHREVREAVATLPRDTGEVISMRYLQERTLREVCEATGLTTQNVRTLEAKGLTQLRELLLA